MIISLLLLTIIFECLALFVLKERKIEFYLFWIALTSFTNLVANIYCIYIFSGSYAEYIIAGIIIEIIVFITEFLLCYAYIKNSHKSLKYSAVCNFTSIFFGLIIQLFI